MSLPLDYKEEALRKDLIFIYYFCQQLGIKCSEKLLDFQYKDSKLPLVTEINYNVTKILSTLVPGIPCSFTLKSSLLWKVEINFYNEYHTSLVIGMLRKEVEILLAKIVSEQNHLRIGQFLAISNKTIKAPNHLIEVSQDVLLIGAIANITMPFSFFFTEIFTKVVTAISTFEGKEMFDLRYSKCFL